MAYQAKTSANMEVGIIREIVGSRQNFAFAHATEGYKLSQFREPAKMKFDNQITKGIKGGEYVDLYTFTLNVPDLLMSPARMRNWYLASKEPNNLRVKKTYRNATTEYLNFIDDTGTPSQDGTTEAGSSLTSLVPTFSIDNTAYKCELDYYGGVTPGQRIWMSNNAGSGQTGGTGGTGSLMTAMTNDRKDRGIPGIYRVDIGGVQVNYIAKENTKWELKGIIPGDRKTYNDLQFVNSYLLTSTVEIMGTRETIELLQSVKDEISKTGTQPSVKWYCQAAPQNAAMTILCDAGTCTVRPVYESGDDTGNLKLMISYEAQFNTSETSPDSMDFGVTNAAQVEFLALS